MNDWPDFVLDLDDLPDDDHSALGATGWEEVVFDLEDEQERSD